eukprot:6180669-Pleurochrysis_carterae.AAC.4
MSSSSQGPSRWGSPARESIVLSNITAKKRAHVQWIPTPEPWQYERSRPVPKSRVPQSSSPIVYSKLKTLLQKQQVALRQIIYSPDVFAVTNAMTLSAPHRCVTSGCRGRRWRRSAHARDHSGATARGRVVWASISGQRASACRWARAWSGRGGRFAGGCRRCRRGDGGEQRLAPRGCGRTCRALRQRLRGAALLRRPA